ncbi:MAG TPA: hypothetical protein VIX59_19205 [Candidatus Binataceae bacterium]
MAEQPTRANMPETPETAQMIEVPAPTAWPMLAALGLTLAFGGLVTSPSVSVVGIVMFIAGMVGWFGAVMPVEEREAVPIVPEAEIAYPRVAIGYLQVGEEGNRARLPLAIYPYTAGIKGGIAGGIVMAALAGAEGIVLHGSPWYTINIMAATAMANLANASTATLASFIPEAFIVALIIHATVSILVGLLYGVLLPMFPRRPELFGGVVAPLLWTGLLWATLDVINPVLDARIEWRWFIVCQIAFGLTAGFVIARSEKIGTLQHLPFAVRMGVEAPGVGHREGRE